MITFAKKNAGKTITNNPKYKIVLHNAIILKYYKKDKVDLFKNIEC